MASLFFFFNGKKTKRIKLKTSLDASFSFFFVRLSFWWLCLQSIFAFFPSLRLRFSVGHNAFFVLIFFSSSWEKSGWWKYITFDFDRATTFLVLFCQRPAYNACRLILFVPHYKISESHTEVENKRVFNKQYEFIKGWRFASFEIN